MAGPIFAAIADPAEADWAAALAMAPMIKVKALRRDQLPPWSSAIAAASRFPVDRIPAVET